jgi:hypothetical protein
MGEFRVLTVFWTWQRRSNLPPSSKLSKMSELKAPQTEATDAADHLAALHAAHSLALDELRARTDALQLQLTSERERHMRREEQLKAEIAKLIRRKSLAVRQKENGWMVFGR